MQQAEQQDNSNVTITRKYEIIRTSRDNFFGGIKNYFKAERNGETGYGTTTQKAIAHLIEKELRNKS